MGESVNFIYRIVSRIKRTLLAIRYRRLFLAFGDGACLEAPLRLEMPKNIAIGDHVLIRRMTWLAAVPLTGAGNCALTIKSGAVIGHFAHIYATGKITIGERALIADKVYISDNTHGFSDPAIPIMDQAVLQRSEVEIGAGAWIGENVCIIGANVGRNAVIGANSVVTKSIPDHCVAVGAPAIIIKRYCHESRTWKRTDSKGEFLG